MTSADHAYAKKDIPNIRKVLFWALWKFFWPRYFVLCRLSKGTMEQIRRAEGTSLQPSRFSQLVTAKEPLSKIQMRRTSRFWLFARVQPSFVRVLKRAKSLKYMFTWPSRLSLCKPSRRRQRTATKTRDEDESLSYTQVLFEYPLRKDEYAVFTIPVAFLQSREPTPRAKFATPRHNTSLPWEVERSTEDWLCWYNCSCKDAHDTLRKTRHGLYTTCLNLSLETRRQWARTQGHFLISQARLAIKKHGL